MIKKICHMLLLLLSGAVLLFASYIILPQSISEWISYYKSASWEKIPVNITKVELRKEITDTDKSRHIVSCFYSFYINDIKHPGKRIEIINADSVSSYPFKRERLLKLYKKENRKFEALVNPRKPSQSSLFREINRSMAAIPVFALGLFAGGCIFFIKSLYRVKILEPVIWENKTPYHKPVELSGFKRFILGLSCFMSGLSEWNSTHMHKQMILQFENVKFLSGIYSFDGNFDNACLMMALGFWFFFSGCLAFYNNFVIPLKQSISESDPDRPWLNNSQWRRFMVYYKPDKKILTRLSWGIFFSILFFMLVIGRFNEIEGYYSLLKYPYFNFWAILILYLSLRNLCSAFYLIIQYIKFGKSALILPQLPLIRGKKYKILLSLNKNISLKHKTECIVKCIKNQKYEEQADNTSGYRNNMEKEVFSKKHSVNLELIKLSPKRYVIPIDLFISKYKPYNSAYYPKYTWKFEISFRAEGISFNPEFDIPVFEVKDPNMIEKPPEHLKLKYKHLPAYVSAEEEFSDSVSEKQEHVEITDNTFQNNKNDRYKRADFSETEFKKDFRELIKHAENRFKDIPGEYVRTATDGDKIYKSDFIIEGSDTAYWHRCPFIYEKSNGTWEYHCLIVPNTPDYNKLLSELEQVVDLIKSLLPDSWTVEINPDSGEYQSRLKANAPNRGIKIDISITPRINYTWDASLSLEKGNPEE